MIDHIGNILFLGDSLTEFGDWPKLLDKPGILNQGMSGDVTTGVLNRLEQVIELSPQKIFLMIGVNDLASRIPENQVIQNILLIVARLNHALPEAAIYLQSLLPINPTVTGFNDDFDYSESIFRINNKLKSHAADAGYTYLDLYTKFIDANNRLYRDYTTDGLHLNESGYKHWAEQIKEFADL